MIAAMVVLSSLLSFVQEYRSNKAAEALRALVHTKVLLRRRMRQEDGSFPATGHPVHVPLAHIVPGDIVQLSAGNLVPADVRVIAAKDLFVNEAALTGESLPVEKLADADRGRARAARGAQPRLHGHLRRERHRDRRRRRDGSIDVLRRHRAGGRRAAADDELRRRHPPLPVAHHPLHAGHGARPCC